MNKFQLNVADVDADEEVAEDGETTLDADGETEEEDTDVVADDGDQDTDEEEDESEEDASEEDSTKLPGIDEVISKAGDELGEGFAEVIRGMARSQVQQGEISALRKELTDELATAKAIKEDLLKVVEDESAEEEDDGSRQLLASADPREIELMQALLKEEGYIKQSTLDAEANAVLASDMDKAGVEMFGESFGDWDEESEEFTLNPEAKDDLGKTFRRLVDDQNLGYRDLFVLTHWDKLIDAAGEAGKEMGLEEARDVTKAKVTKARKAGKSSNGTAAGSSVKRYYDKENMKGEGPRKRIGSVMGDIWKDIVA